MPRTLLKNLGFFFFFFFFFFFANSVSLNLAQKVSKNKMVEKAMVIDAMDLKSRQRLVLLDCHLTFERTQ